MSQAILHAQRAIIYINHVLSTFSHCLHLFLAGAGTPLLKFWCLKQSVVSAVLAGKKNDAFTSLEKVEGNSL